MKLSLATEDLAAALIGRIQDGRSPIEVFNTVHLEADREGLVLAANNGRVWLRQRVAAEVTKPGCADVNGVRFMAAAKALPKKSTVNISAAKTLTISQGAARFRLSVLPDPPPALAKSESIAWSFEAPTNDFQEALRQTSAAASTDKTVRTYLNSVTMAPDGKHLVLSAAQTQAIHRTRLEAKIECFEALPVIVPLEAVNLLLALSSDIISVQFDKERGEVVSGDTAITFRLIDATPVAFDDVVQARPDGLVVDRLALLEAVKRASCLSETLTNTIGGNAVFLQSSGKDLLVAGHAGAEGAIERLPVASGNLSVCQTVGVWRNALSTRRGVEVEISTSDSQIHIHDPDHPLDICVLSQMAGVFPAHLLEETLEEAAA